MNPLFRRRILRPRTETRCVLVQFHTLYMGLTYDLS